MKLATAFLFVLQCSAVVVEIAGERVPSEPPCQDRPDPFVTYSAVWRDTPVTCCADTDRGPREERQCSGDDKKCDPYCSTNLCVEVQQFCPAAGSYPCDITATTIRPAWYKLRTNRNDEESCRYVPAKVIRVRENPGCCVQSDEGSIQPLYWGDLKEDPEPTCEAILPTAEDIALDYVDEFPSEVALEIAHVVKERIEAKVMDDMPVIFRQVCNHGFRRKGNVCDPFPEQNEKCCLDLIPVHDFARKLEEGKKEADASLLRGSLSNMLDRQLGAYRGDHSRPNEYGRCDQPGQICVVSKPDNEFRDVLSWLSGEPSLKDICLGDRDKVLPSTWCVDGNPVPDDRPCCSRMKKYTGPLDRDLEEDFHHDVVERQLGRRGRLGGRGLDFSCRRCVCCEDEHAEDEPCIYCCGTPCCEFIGYELEEVVPIDDASVLRDRRQLGARGSRCDRRLEGDYIIEEEECHTCPCCEDLTVIYDDIEPVTFQADSENVRTLPAGRRMTASEGFEVDVLGHQRRHLGHCMPCKEPDGRDCAGCGGDPHVKTWSGDYYDFHGECDLVLLTSAYLASNTTLTVHIRTEIRHGYSFIKNAAVAIGSGRESDDVLVVSGWGEYMINGVGEASLPYAMDSTHPITHEKKDKNHAIFAIDLGNEQKLELKTFKDWVSISLDNVLKRNFQYSGGLMGQFGTGALVGRDGKTVFEDPNSFGQHWQVLESEPSLFPIVRPPQHPHQGCIMPDASIAEGRRRLGETVSQDEAEEACAHWGDDAHKEICIYDTMVSGDLEMAQAGSF